jgi:hypothetical protein
MDFRSTNSGAGKTTYLLEVSPLSSYELPGVVRQNRSLSRHIPAITRNTAFLTSASNLEDYVKYSVNFATKLASLLHSSDFRQKQGLQKIFPEGTYYNKNKRKLEPQILTLYFP